MIYNTECNIKLKHQTEPSQQVEQQSRELPEWIV